MSDTLSDWVVTPPLSPRRHRAPPLQTTPEPAAATTTENGAPSLACTGSARLNLYFKLTRDVTHNPHFYEWLDAAWEEDPIDTLVILFHGRDCRGGKGDRAPYLDGLFYLLKKHSVQVAKCIPFIPEYGRFLDWVQLASAIHQSGECNRLYDATYTIIECIAKQLQDDVHNMEQGKPISLLAKWLPSEGKKWDRKSNLTRQLAGYIYRVPQKKLASDDLKHFRQQYLSPLRAYLKLVEGYMCSGKWSDIEFSKVPSVAMHRLKAAFKRHEPERFAEWLVDVKKGEQKINSSQVYPHDLVAKYLAYDSNVYDDIDASMDTHKPDEVIEAQWAAMLEHYRAKGAVDKALVVCDVSGSMEGTPMQVAIALGILISQLTQPAFQGRLITFSHEPQLHQLADGGSLLDHVQSVRRMPWGMNTDLQKVFQLILDHAVARAVPANEMPTRLFILSDMQFDQACNVQPTRGRSRYTRRVQCDAEEQGTSTPTTFELIRESYAAAGYEMPQIVFWNLRSNTTKDFPVKHNEHGVALVSGFSPSILAQLLESDDLTPWALLRAVLDSKRYAPVRAALL